MDGILVALYFIAGVQTQQNKPSLIATFAAVEQCEKAIKQFHSIGSRAPMVCIEIDRRWVRVD